MKRQYWVCNWSESNAALKQRGSLTFWISDDVLEQWLVTTKTGRRGASQRYSDLAIATVSTLQSLFHLPGRQAEGFLDSLFTQMQVDLPVPDHSTISRRLGQLQVTLPVVETSSPRHIVVDGTGIRVYGPGEWHQRQHRPGQKRRKWHKLHLGGDEATSKIVVAQVTTRDYHDCEILPSLLDGISDEIRQVSADGAYDTFACYEAIAQRQADAAIPPRQNAQWVDPTARDKVHPRDQILACIEHLGRRGWQRASGYHRRSLVETIMFRLKVTFGGRVRCRRFENQAVELLLQCAALNRMIQLGKPDSYVLSA
jgi:IS5 family transposase